jgi:putative heme-binding domain-containing protein
MKPSPQPTGGAFFVALAAIAASVTVATVAVLWVMWPAPRAAPVTTQDMQSRAADLVDAAPLAANPRTPQPTPRWLWSSATPGANERVALERRWTITKAPRSAQLVVAADNRAAVLLDGKGVGSAEEWQSPTGIDLTGHLLPGEHTLTIEATNDGGPAGVAAVLALSYDDGSNEWIVTDGLWSVRGADGAAASVTDLGNVGVAPWGDLAGLVELDRNIAVPEGFVVDVAATIPKTLGSVVSLCPLPDGSLLAGLQGPGLLRIGLPSDASGMTTVEKLPVDIGGVQGMLVADGVVYAVVNGGFAEGSGLYRLDDSNGDGRLDARTRLRAIDGDGEHGPHGIALGPDGRIYLMGGNHTALPKPESSLVPPIWGEDIVLPRLWDANGHAVGIMAPGGWVVRMDKDGRNAETFAIGFRNAYDIAFNEYGDLFSYDSDMEWDMGAPWYRPTRITHIVPAAEFGWRSGSACWPAWYPDSLPPTLDMGPGSPTGVVFLRDTNFPKPWRDAMLALDWTFGTIHAIYLEPDGATYKARRETFLTGKPMPLTDAVVSPKDRALYVSVGGRGAASTIYRISATSPDASPANSPLPLPPAHERRRALEAFYSEPPSQAAVDAAWARLDDEDRFVRFAARTVLEKQPTLSWAERALRESNPAKASQALLALVRVGDDGLRVPALASLRTLDWAKLTPVEQQTVARATMVGLARAKEIPDEEREQLRMAWDRRFPSDDDGVDRVISEMLVSLDSRAVIGKAISELEKNDALTESFDETLLKRSDSYGSVIMRMAAANPQREQVHMATVLRQAKIGWTPSLRDRYFRWFPQARRTAGGLSFAGFLEMIRRDALANVPEAERARYDKMSAAPNEAETADRPSAKGPGRAWTTAEVERIGRERTTGRDFARGEAMFAAASCIDCHRMAGAGKNVGPDLTAVGSRFGPREMAEAIVEPSKVVSDQYVMEEFTLADSSVALGRVVSEENDEIRIIENMLAPDFVRTIKASDVRERRKSAVSPMMGGLINQLNEDELADLLAYLRSGGDKRLVK